MRLFTFLFACALVFLGIRPLLAAPEAIAVEPNPTIPGQTVTFRWYFTGDKVVVSGGRFGKGTVVTGRTRLTDAPRKTTIYTFNVWYRVPKEPSSTDSAATIPAFASYKVVVQVLPMLLLRTYWHTHGWQIDYVKGWRYDSVPLPDPANNALIFFQQEEDSVERLAVSVLPAQGMSSAELMKQVEASLPANYGKPEMRQAILERLVRSFQFTNELASTKRQVV